MRLALAIALFFSALFAGDSAAEIENGVLKDSAGGFAIKLPSGWRISDQPSYPGVAAWLRRTTPLGTIWIASEPVDKNLICSWPPVCRNPNESIASNYACAVETQLRIARVSVSRLSWDPKAIPTTDFAAEWLTYSTKSRAVRQAFMVNAQNAVTIAISAPNSATLKSHLRDFEQMLRTIRAIKSEAAATAIGATGEGGATSGAGAGSSSGRAASGAGSGVAPAAPNVNGSNAGSSDVPTKMPPTPSPNADVAPTTPAAVRTDEERLAELYQSKCETTAAR